MYPGATALIVIPRPISTSERMRVSPWRSGADSLDCIHETTVVRGRGPPVRAVVQDDVRALARQRERDTSPHALARTAGNEGDAAVQRPCHAAGNGVPSITLPGQTDS